MLFPPLVNVSMHMPMQFVCVYVLCVCVNPFSFLLSIYLGVELLDHMVL